MRSGHTMHAESTTSHGNHFGPIEWQFFVPRMTEQCNCGFACERFLGCANLGWGKR